MIFGNICVCFFDAVFCFFMVSVFEMEHFRGPICHFFRADSWAPVPNCPGPNCPGPNCPGPNCPGPNCPGPNLPRSVGSVTNMRYVKA